MLFRCRRARRPPRSPGRASPRCRSRPRPRGARASGRARSRPHRGRVLERTALPPGRRAALGVGSAVGLLPHLGRVGAHARQLPAPCGRAAARSRTAGGCRRRCCGIRSAGHAGRRRHAGGDSRGRTLRGRRARESGGRRGAARDPARRRSTSIGLPRITLRHEPGPTDAPLRGIRVLDLTRVIAGPVATRTLALLGADVLRIDPPALPEPEWQHLDSGHGKRSTLLDLAANADRETFERLLQTADVVVTGYRARALERLGLSPESLIARRPGLVVARLTAWGSSGASADRRGFDSLVQAASGIAWIESPDGVRPRRPARAGARPQLGVPPRRGGRDGACVDDARRADRG